jgi:hypothetical protein
VVLLNVTAASPLSAQQFFAFEGRRYFDPLIAGVREPHISAVIGTSSRMAFQVSTAERRLAWDIDVGAELPLFGWESAAAVSGKVPARATGIGLWFPIDFHMIEDFEDASNPIVNNDYRFGLMLKLQRWLSPTSHLGMRLHVGHESTHLGDEFSILALQHHPATFERINVSWEFLDTSVLYERNFGAGEWSVRAGVTSTLPFGDSYYSTDDNSVTGSPIGIVTESANWLDPHGGFQVQWDELAGDGFFSRFAGYGSVELRWRSIYDYHKADAGDRESRRASFNVIAGVKPTGVGDLGLTSLFIRLYNGVNPHGQFRNQRDFTFVGFGMRLVR